MNLLGEIAAEPLFDQDQIGLLDEALGADGLRGMLEQLPPAAAQSFDSIQEAVQAGDIGAARAAAHVLKGFASSLGAARLSSLSAQMELQCETIAELSERLPVLAATIEATVRELPRATEKP